MDKALSDLWWIVTAFLRGDLGDRCGGGWISVPDPDLGVDRRGAN